MSPKLKLTTRQETKLTTTLELRQELKDQVALMERQLEEIDKGLRVEIEQYGWNTINKDKKKSRVLEVGSQQLVLTFCTKHTLNKEKLLAAGVAPDMIADGYKETPYTQLRARQTPAED